MAFRAAPGTGPGTGNRLLCRLRRTSPRPLIFLPPAAQPRAQGVVVARSEYGRRPVQPSCATCVEILGVGCTHEPKQRSRREPDLALGSRGCLDYRQREIPGPKIRTRSFDWLVKERRYSLETADISVPATGRTDENQAWIHMVDCQIGGQRKCAGISKRSSILSRRLQAKRFEQLRSNSLERSAALTSPPRATNRPSTAPSTTSPTSPPIFCIRSKQQLRPRTEKRRSPRQELARLQDSVASKLPGQRQPQYCHVLQFGDSRSWLPS